MTTANNNMNTTILTAEETSALFAGSDLIVEDSFQNLAENIGGAGTSFANFDASAIRQRINFVEGIGPNLSDLTSLDAVLELSGLNFEVARSKKPVSFYVSVPGMPPKQISMKDKFATYRTDTLEPLGVVGERFNILQNRDAFNFLENLQLEGLRYEAATCYGKNGAKSFICMSAEDVEILSDNFKPYILFINSHDASKAVQVMFTSVRVFCQNAINRAIKGAKNRVSIRHSASMEDRLAMAHKVLFQNNNYMLALKDKAETLALKPFSEDQFYAWVKAQYPVDETVSKRGRTLNEQMINAIMGCYYENDLDNFNNTAWRAIQAISDLESHMPIRRTTKRPEFANFNNVVEQGMPLLDSIWSVVEEAV